MSFITASYIVADLIYYYFDNYYQYSISYDSIHAYMKGQEHSMKYSPEKILNSFALIDFF